MNCSLTGTNARAFAKAIQTLAKFSSELYMEATRTALYLRAFNISQSAMGTFRFNDTFFEAYNVAENQNESFCKICMGLILSAFKSMRQVERCDIRLLVEQSQLQVKFICRSEIIKNIVIRTMDEENCTVDVSRDDLPNVIVGSFTVFQDIANNFNACETEITLEAMDNSLTAKNYIEGTRVNDNFMRSQLKLSSNEFETFSIKEESNITFTYKEFRSFLQYAENINEPVTLNFHHAGGPVLITINKPGLIECTLVMTTVNVDDVTLHESCRESDIVNMSSSTCDNSVHQPQKRKHSNPTVNNMGDNVSKKRLSEETTLSNVSTVFQFNTHSNTQIESLDGVRNLTQTNMEMMDDGQEDIFLAAVIASDSNVMDSNTTQLPTLQRPELAVTFASTESNNRLTTDNFDADSIPQSPPRVNVTKLRSIFARCFEATYVPREPSPSSQMFVADSDTED